MKGIEEISLMLKSGINRGLLLPNAGFFEPKDILSFVSRKAHIQNIYQELFGKITIENLIENYTNWHITFDEIKVSVSPIEEWIKLKTQKKMKWVMRCSYELELRTYDLILPFPNKDHLEAAMIGLVPMTEFSRLLEWMEYYIVVEDKSSGKKQTKKMTINESRDELTLMDRVYSFWLEDALLLALVQYSRNLLIKHARFDLDTMDLLYSWCRIHTDTMYQRLLLKNDSLEIYPKWENFLDFVQWANKNHYEKSHFPSRISYHEGYTPKNTQWVPLSDSYLLSDRYYPTYQYKSFRSRRSLESEYVTLNGKRQTLLEWENETNIPFHIIESRIHMGWKDSEVLSSVRKRPNEFLHSVVKINGISKTIKQWSEFSGISSKTLISRMRYGWDHEDLLRPPTPRSKQ